MSDNPVLTIGIITDTHVPDRFNQVSPEILTFLKKEKVAAILHAGDISSPLVLDALKQIAPVHAVQGNRDWAFKGVLPLTRELNFLGVSIGLAHGHGGMYRYVVDKLKYLKSGYRYERYRDLLLALFPSVNVIVFGHTHRPVNRFENRQLVFNPGAAYPCRENDYHVQAGLLRIFTEERFEGEIFSLSNTPPPRGR